MSMYASQINGLEWIWDKNHETTVIIIISSIYDLWLETKRPAVQRQCLSHICGFLGSKHQQFAQRVSPFLHRFL